MASEVDTSALREELGQTVERIEALSAQLHCDDTTQCAWLPVGQQACGGPAGHQMYSTLIGHEAVLELLELGRRSAELQRQINLAEFAISTCGVPVPPPLMCHRNSCVALDPAFHPAMVRDARGAIAAIVFATRLDELSARLAGREIDDDLHEKILYRSAGIVAECLLEEATSDPNSTLAPYVSSASSLPYADQDLRAQLVAGYDEATADAQLGLAAPILDRCIEAETMFVLSTYPRPTR